ncbi:MAG: DUF4168 domain-containing protein [Cyanobacteria bacterium P01_F01_bin.53]
MTMNSCRYASAWLAVALGALTFTAVGIPTRVGGLVEKSLVPAAQAQARVTEDDVANYARAVFDIEASRTAAYESAANILASADSELDLLETPLSCTSARLSDMPDIPRADRVELLTVLVNFCNEASEIAEVNNLTPKRFNSITAAHQEDAELAERIQSEISSL